MVFAIERPIPLTLKMAENRENPEKIGDERSHLSSGGRPAKPLYTNMLHNYLDIDESTCTIFVRSLDIAS